MYIETNNSSSLSHQARSMWLHPKIISNYMSPPGLLSSICYKTEEAFDYGYWRSCRNHGSAPPSTPSVPQRCGQFFTCCSSANHRLESAENSFILSASSKTPISHSIGLATFLSIAFDLANPHRRPMRKFALLIYLDYGHCRPSIG